MRELTRTRPGRTTVATIAVATGSSLLLGGCSFWSPDVSLYPYAPADGLQAELGDLLIRNVLVVSEGGSQDGLLVGALANRGQEEVEVAVEVAGVPVEVLVVPADEVLQLGPEDGSAVPGIGPSQTATLVLEDVEALPGNVVEVRFVDPDTGSVVLDVPIMLPDGYYEDYTP